MTAEQILECSTAEDFWQDLAHYRVDYARAAGHEIATVLISAAELCPDPFWGPTEAGDTIGYVSVKLPPDALEAFTRDLISFAKSWRTAPSAK